MTNQEARARALVIRCFDDAPDRKPPWLVRLYAGTVSGVACETDRGHIAIWVATSNEEKLRHMRKGFGVPVVEVRHTDTVPRVRNKVLRVMEQAYARVAEDGRAEEG